MQKSSPATKSYQAIFTKGKKINEIDNCVARLNMKIRKGKLPITGIQKDLSPQILQRLKG